MSQTTLMVISSAIFIIAYIFIIIDKIDRTVTALLGACLMVAARVISQQQAFLKIDYNTLVLLIGMMIIVMITKRTGVFEYLAIKTIKFAKAEPWKILFFLAVITGLISSLLDNVTTILLVLPVTVTVAKDLKLNPIPFTIAEVFASNIGGTATLIGDPPNIMIGSSAGLSFMDFVKNLTLPVMLILLVTSYIFVLIYRKKLNTSAEARRRVMAMDEKSAIKNPALLKKSLVVIALTILGFVLHGYLGYESSTVAFSGAAALLLISGEKVGRVLEEVEWKTILFFAGLFVMVGGLEAAGIIDMIARWLMSATHGDPALTMIAVLWGSAIASAFIDNIPFVATMIPLIKGLGAMSGMALGPIWWALSLGACFGGNGTIIGASANVVASGMMDEEHKISFAAYFKVAFPMMLLSVVLSMGYLLIFYR